MKNIHHVVLLLFLTVSLNAQNNSIIIQNVNLIDTEHERIIPNQNIYIVDDIIYDIKNYNPTQVQDGQHIIHAEGKYVLPGLINSHIHLGNFYANDTTRTIEKVLNSFLVNGVLGVRNTGDFVSAVSQLVSLRDRIDIGKKLGPKLFVSGIIVNDRDANKVLEYFNVKSYKEVVTKYKEMGVDGIKFKLLDKQIAEEVINQSLSLKLNVFGHTANGRYWDIDTLNYNGDYSLKAIDKGINGILHLGEYAQYDKIKAPSYNFEVKNGNWTEHWERIWIHTYILWNYIDEIREEKLMNSAIKNNVWIEPTLLWESSHIYKSEFYKKPYYCYYFGNAKEIITWFPKPTKSELIELQKADQKRYSFIKRFYNKGGAVLVGTDGMVYGFELIEEMKLLVNAGIPVSAVIKAATYNNSKALGWLDTMGTISIGKKANLVLLNANPMKNIENLQEIESIINQGKIYNKKELTKMKKELLIFANSKR